MNNNQIKPNWINNPSHKPKFIKIKNSKIHNKGAFATKPIKNPIASKPI